MINNHQRPICVNHGCNNPVIYSRKNEDGSKRWRVHCSPCQKASYGRKPHRPGVIPYKTGKCSNIDGHLGFFCYVKWDEIPNHSLKGITEIDHKDGNYHNNDLDNLDELCMICHKIKGITSGDFQKRYTKSS